LPPYREAGQSGSFGCDLKRGELGVGAQHIEPVKARVFGDPRLVDGEVLGRDGLEIAAETAVADERLVALGELGAGF
jgi:hypothetical protein